MRKEVVIVIVVGILIGAIVAFGIYTAQSAIKNRESQPESEQQPEQDDEFPDMEHTLSVLEPVDESIAEEEEIPVTGSTTPDAVITILAQENEYLLTADSEGHFSTNITLVGGANTITVTAFNADGERAEQTLTVVYSTEL